MQRLLDGTMCADVIGSPVQTRGLDHMKGPQMEGCSGAVQETHPLLKHRFSLCVAGRKMPFINGSHNHIRAWFYSLAFVLQLSVFSYISF